MTHYFYKCRESKGLSLSVILILLAILVGGQIVIKRFFSKHYYKGDGFRIEVPEGWEKRKVDDDTVMFVCPEEDFFSETPEALMTFYSKSSKGALFLDDYYAQVMESLYASGVRILKKGEIKVGGLLSQWILYKSFDPEVLVLSFYFIDDFNRLFQIQYVAKPETFEKHRPVFEKVKDSFEHRAFGGF